MGTNFVRGCGVAFVRPRDTTVPKVGRAGEAFVQPFSTNYHYTLIYIFFVQIAHGPKGREHKFTMPIDQGRKVSIRSLRGPAAGGRAN